MVVNKAKLYPLICPSNNPDVSSGYYSRDIYYSFQILSSDNLITSHMITLITLTIIQVPVPQLSRGLSLSLPAAATAIRAQAKHLITTSLSLSLEEGHDEKQVEEDDEMLSLHEGTFQIPDFSGYSDEFRGYLKKDLTQTDHMEDLGLYIYIDTSLSLSLSILSLYIYTYI